MKAVLFSLALVFASLANANTHMFYCSLTSQEPHRQVYFEIDSNALESRIGNVSVAKMSANDLGWQVIEQAQVRADIAWGQVNGETEITGVKINMGKSGNLSYSRNAKGGFVQASLMSLNFPTGVQFDHCMYFLSTGIKPGMTGSN